jgi:DNA-binding response OmpR family regulator
MAYSTVPYAILVEDNPLIMMGTSVILKEAGFRVYKAFDGEEAIALLQENGRALFCYFPMLTCREVSAGLGWLVM